MIDRIKRDALVPYVTLNEAELKHYSGAGYAIAYLDGDQIIELQYVEEIDEDGGKAEIERAIAAGAWLGLCSATQLCEPRLFSAAEAAKIMRLVAENYDL